MSDVRSRRCYPTTFESVMARVEWNDGCVVFRGGHAGKPGNRRPQVRRNGVMTYVSHIVWELFHGPIPDGMFVLHHCDNPGCLLIDHLFLGTLAENMQDAVKKGRMANQKKTACVNGHPFDEENTYYVGPRKWRYCKTCRRAIVRRSRAKRRRAQKPVQLTMFDPPPS